LPRQLGERLYNIWHNLWRHDFGSCSGSFN
jgi:hypothetical protein